MNGSGLLPADYCLRTKPTVSTVLRVLPLLLNQGSKTYNGSSKTALLMRLLRGLKVLYSYYTELKALSSTSLEEYKSNAIYRRAIERTMQSFLHLTLGLVFPFMGQSNRPRRLFFG